LKRVPNYINFGDVYQGDVLTRDFPITNNDTETWIVKDILKSCSCARTSIEKQSIPPGDETILKTVLDTVTEAHRTHKRINVYFTNGKKMRVTLFANIQPLFEIEPKNILFELDKQKCERPEMPFHANFTPVLDNLKILGATISDNNINVTFQEEVYKDKVSYRFTFLVPADISIGSNDLVLNVKTNHPIVQDQFNYPVRMIVTDGFEITQKILNFGVLYGKKKTEWTKMTSDHPFHVLAVTPSASLEFATIDIRSCEEKLKWVVFVTIDPKQSEDEFEGKLYIQTDHPVHTDIEIDVLGEVRRNDVSEKTVL